MYVHSSSVTTSASSSKTPELKKSMTPSSGKKDWKQGTKDIVEIFQCKDDEISHWMTQCKKLEFSVNQLEQIREQKIQLEQEFQTLRQVLSQKDYEIDQLRRNYEDQSRGFSEKGAEMECELESQANEIERLRQHISLKNSELDGCKGVIGKLEQRVSEIRRLETMCREKDQHITMLQQNNDDWRQRFMKSDAQVEELRKFQDISKDLEMKLKLQYSEIDRLNLTIKHQLGEGEAYRARISELEIQVSQMRALEARIKEFEKRFQMMSTEAGRLNDVISMKNQDIQELRDRLKQNESTIAGLKVSEEKCGELELHIRNLSGLISEERAKVANLHRQLDQAKQLEVKIREQENKIAGMKQDIEHLNSAINYKCQELEGALTQIRSLEKQIQQYRGIEQTVNEQENRIGILLNEMDRLRDFLEIKNKEVHQGQSKITLLEEACTKYENQINELSHNIADLTLEVDVFSKQLNDVARQNDELQNQRKLQASSQKEFESRNNQLRDEIEYSRNYIQKKDEEISGLKGKCQQLESQVIEMYSIREKNRSLINEIDRLNAQLASLSEENQDLKINLIDNSELQAKHQNLLILSVQLFAEVESLRSRIKDKEKEIFEMRKQSLNACRQ